MSSIDSLLDKTLLWRSRQRSQTIKVSSQPTGHTELNQSLNSGGWPLAGSTELLCGQQGMGELRLLLPALVNLSQQHHIAWLNPPHQAYVPALQQAGLKLENCLFIKAGTLKDQLWAGEELLKSACFAAVIHWSGKQAVSDRDLRRLQLAAREHHCWHVHFRDMSLQRQSSPAPLRIGLNGTTEGLELHILKQSAGPAGQRVFIQHPAQLAFRQQPVSQWPSTAIPAPAIPASGTPSRLKRLRMLKPVSEIQTPSEVQSVRELH